MVIHDFDLVGFVAIPLKTDSPSLIDSYAELVLPIALQFLQVVRGRSTQVVQRTRIMKHAQLPIRGLLDLDRQPPGELPSEDLLRLPIPDGGDHKSSI